jgi:phosphoribosyl 1,2-cyclic phosphate phosphodiesterase
MSMPLTLTFLGTGTSQGIPVIGSQHPVCLSHNPKDKRLRVSVLIQWGDRHMVIDCGPDFRQQMLRAQVQQLDALLLTHEHNDHMAGLDDVRPYNFMQKRSLPMFGTLRVLNAVKERFSYVFADQDKYPGAPSIDAIAIKALEPFDCFGKKIMPIEARHGNLPILGFRIDDLAYMTDVKTLSAASLEELKNLDVLVLSALRIEPHPTHLNLDEALILIEQLKPKRAYLTHISHLMGFHDEVSSELPEGVFIAYDNLKIHTS